MPPHHFWYFHFPNNFDQKIINTFTLRKKCPYSKLVWSVFPRIRTEYGEIRSISAYSVHMRENTDQNHSEYRHFLRCVSDIVELNEKSENLTKQMLVSSKNLLHNTAQKIKFSIKDFLSKCDQVCRFLRTWSHLLKKSLMENFVFYAV